MKLTEQQKKGIFVIAIIAAIIGGGLFSIVPLAGIGGMNSYSPGETATWRVYLSPQDGKTLAANLGCGNLAVYTPITIQAQSYLQCNRVSGTTKTVAQPALTTTMSCNYFNSGGSSPVAFSGTSSAVVPTDATSCKITVTFSSKYGTKSATQEDTTGTGNLVIMGQGGTTAAPACTNGQKQCFGGQPKTCVNGIWQQQVVCTVGCSNGDCVKECTPGQTKCPSTSKMYTCDSAGQYTIISYAPTPQSQYSCIDGKWVNMAPTPTPTTPTPSTGGTIPTTTCAAMTLPSGILDQELANWKAMRYKDAGVALSDAQALSEFRQVYPTDKDVCVNNPIDFQIVTQNGCQVCQVRDYSSFDTCSDGSRRPAGTCPTPTTTPTTPETPSTPGATQPSTTTTGGDLVQQLGSLLGGGSNATVNNCYTQGGEAVAVGACTTDKTLRCTQTSNSSRVFISDITCETVPQVGTGGGTGTTGGQPINLSDPMVLGVGALVVIVVGAYLYSKKKKGGRK